MTVFSTYNDKMSTNQRRAQDFARFWQRNVIFWRKFFCVIMAFFRHIVTIIFLSICDKIVPLCVNFPVSKKLTQNDTILSFSVNPLKIPFPCNLHTWYLRAFSKNSTLSRFSKKNQEIAEHFTDMTLIP